MDRLLRLTPIPLWFIYFFTTAKAQGYDLGTDWGHL